MEKGHCRRHASILDSAIYRRGGTLYDSRRWKRKRDKFISRHPICVDCGRLAQTVDHVVPYEAEDVLSFWDESNWQSLCFKCHGRKTRRDVENRTY